MKKQKIYTNDESLLLMEVSGLLSFYFLWHLYIQGNKMDKCTSIINTWTQEFFKTYGHLENINLIGWEPYNYGFSNEVCRFQDAVKEFGEMKAGFKIDISKRTYENINGVETYMDKLSKLAEKDICKIK
jgi:hypothetical protein